jgi:hypothetical protein
MLKIALVASEAVPFAKTGGIAYQGNFSLSYRLSTASYKRMKTNKSGTKG